MLTRTHPHGLSDTTLMSSSLMSSSEGFRFRVVKEVPYGDDTLIFKERIYRCPMCYEDVAYDYLWSSNHHGGGLGGLANVGGLVREPLEEYVRSTIALLELDIRERAIAAAGESARRMREVF